MAVDPTSDGYRPPVGRDEMVDDVGAVRPPWRILHDELTRLGPERLTQLDARVRRTLRRHGTTYQIHGGNDLTWVLDPVPMVVAREEWSGIAAGLEQRARLLSEVLRDLYGEQRTLRAGLVPAEAVFRDPGFLPNMVGVDPPGGRPLPFHAVDLVRGPDGEIRALGDRCEAPSGAGYALENREVLAPAVPDLIRRAGVRRIVDWFETVRDALAGLAPAGVEDPRIVLFSAGPGSRMAFEHSFLAQSLGYSLVEPGDLTVRGGSVWLKSVSGLEPVHVILRRVPGASADPLELDPDGVDGVAGLVEACRRGTVAIANPLGSAAGSNTALLPFLPGLCRELLGEDLLLPSIDTWWLGEEMALDHALADVDEFVFKPLTRSKTSGVTARFGRLLDKAGRDRLRRELRADPALWTAQTEVTLPTTPSLTKRGALAPRLVLMRGFTVHDGDQFHVMDGALSRSGDASDRITIFEGGASKDTWIVDPLGPRAPVAPRRPVLRQIDLGGSVTSRAAESMFWVGRNLERAEVVVRLVHAIDRYLDQWPELATEANGAFVRAATRAVHTLVGDGPLPRADVPLEELLGIAVADLGRPRSLATSLRFLVSGAGAVRELFSTDSWRLLNDLSDVAGALAAAPPDTLLEESEASITPLAALSGLLAESMVRDPGWRFLDCGRRLERAHLLIGTMRASMVTPVAGWVEGPLYEMVLASWESLVSYRRRYRSDIEPAALLSLMVLDGSNPRSMRSSVDALGADLRALPLDATLDRSAILAAERARDVLVEARAVVLVRPDGVRRAALVDLLDRVSEELDAASEALSQRYFVHVRSTALVGQRSRAMVTYRVTHTTTYRYSDGATLCSNLAHLRPRATSWQTVDRSIIDVDPVPDDRSDGVDVFGNHRTYFTVERPHDELAITAQSEVTVTPPEVSDQFDEAWDRVRRRPLDASAEAVFRLPSRLVPSLAHVAKFAEESFVPGRPLREAVSELTARIHEDYTYDPSATTVATPLADVVAARRGVCQDFAHLAVGALRSVGLAARYVSGYLETFPPPGAPKLIGADASHAWASVRGSEGSWLDLDPTNDVVAPETHVTVGWGRDFSDVVPVKGVVLSPAGSTTLDVVVDVARIDPVTRERTDGAVDVPAPVTP